MAQGMTHPTPAARAAATSPRAVLRQMRQPAVVAAEVPPLDSLGDMFSLTASLCGACTKRCNVADRHLLSLSEGAACFCVCVCVCAQPVDHVQAGRERHSVRFLRVPAGESVLVERIMAEVALQCPSQHGLGVTCAEHSHAERGPVHAVV